MNSSNDLLHEVSRNFGSPSDPGFATIVAFDYYDGPEHGLALDASGSGVRFASLGDSTSRLFRAFELIPIEGNWWPQVKALQRREGADPASRMLLPSEVDTLTELESRVLQASALGQFVCVGSPDLVKISICPVTHKELETLRKLGCSPAGFEFAHRLVKTWKSAL